MKTYILILSNTFPVGHHKAGEQTWFAEKLLKSQGKYAEINSNFWNNLIPKIHTIRSNYDTWHKRVSEVRRGEALISIRQWSGKPYRSKQVEICKITKDNNPGTQQVFMTYNSALGYEVSVNSRELFGKDEREKIAENDGLSVDSFSDWFFKKGKVDEYSGVIIHFTGFRY